VDKKKFTTTVFNNFKTAEALTGSARQCLDDGASSFDNRWHVHAPSIRAAIDALQVKGCGFSVKFDPDFLNGAVTLRIQVEGSKPAIVDHYCGPLKSEEDLQERIDATLREHIQFLKSDIAILEGLTFGK